MLTASSRAFHTPILLCVSNACGLSALLIKINHTGLELSPIIEFPLSESSNTVILGDLSTDGLSPLFDSQHFVLVSLDCRKSDIAIHVALSPWLSARKGV